MRYCLGIDIGNSVVTAAVADRSGVETVGLGRQSSSMPALVHVTPDGTILTGDDAVRATDLEPTWSARMLARRLDDPASIQLGERACEVADLLSAVLWDVLDRVATLRGAAPEHVVLTRPGCAGPTWTGSAGGGRRQGGSTGCDDDHGPTRPVAPGSRTPAARAPGSRSTTSVAAPSRPPSLRADAQGVELVCPPDGAPQLGGAELDDLVHDYLDTRLDGALTRWDPRTREGARARDRVLAACATAKETLSTERRRRGDVAAAVGHPAGAVLHREEIDALFRRPVADTVAALRRVLDAAGERPGVLVLTGGSARIPLVTALDPGRDRARRPHRARAGRGGGVGRGAARQQAGGRRDARSRTGATARGPEPRRPAVGSERVRSERVGSEGAGSGSPIRGVGSAGAATTPRVGRRPDARRIVAGPLAHPSAQLRAGRTVRGAAPGRPPHASPTRSSAHTNPQLRLPVHAQQAPAAARSPAPRPRPGPCPPAPVPPAPRPGAAAPRRASPPARTASAPPAAAASRRRSACPARSRRACRASAEPGGSPDGLLPRPSPSSCRPRAAHRVRAARRADDRVRAHSACTPPVAPPVPRGRLQQAHLRSLRRPLRGRSAAPPPPAPPAEPWPPSAGPPPAPPRRPLPRRPPPRPPPTGTPTATRAGATRRSGARSPSRSRCSLSSSRSW